MDDAVRETFGAFSEVEVRGKTFLEMTTITLRSQHSLSSELKKRGASMLDVRSWAQLPWWREEKQSYLSAEIEPSSKGSAPPSQNIEGSPLRRAERLGPPTEARPQPSARLYVVALGEAVQFASRAGSNQL